MGLLKKVIGGTVWDWLWGGITPAAPPGTEFLFERAAREKELLAAVRF